MTIQLNRLPNNAILIKRIANTFVRGSSICLQDITAVSVRSHSMPPNCVSHPNILPRSSRVSAYQRKNACRMDKKWVVSEIEYQLPYSQATIKEIA